MTNSAADEYFAKMTGDLTNSLLTCTIARIISIDFERMVCEVLPENSEDNTPIEDVPFGFMQNDNFVIRFPYKEGDRVFIGFCKEDITPNLYGDENRDNAEGETFQLNGAFVIGGIQQFTKTHQIPSAHDESLLICRKDFKSRIEIDKDGKIIVETDENIEMTSKKDVIIKGENITLEGTSVTANGEDLTIDLT